MGERRQYVRARHWQHGCNRPMKRCFALIALSIGFLLPAASAFAQTPPDCQTPNGTRSLSRMAGELLSVGYGGPWDPGAVIAAYARTTGGAVTCGNTPAPSGPRTAVVMVGGLGSTRVSDSDTFGLLESQLAGQGYSADDLLLWSYAPSGDSCAPLASTGAGLGQFVRGLRDTHRADRVTLVGHSNGGVVLYAMIAANPDLIPFLRGVVTIDSPLEGISDGRAGLRALWDGPCPAADDLVGLAASTAWAPALGTMATGLLNRGVAVAALWNPYDSLVPVAAQQINATANYEVDASDGGFSNHWAALKDPNGLAQIAQLIGPQGQ
jgi:pimeloyl-ACP methyl ester carboxylesterase